MGLALVTPPPGQHASSILTTHNSCTLIPLMRGTWQPGIGLLKFTSVKNFRAMTGFEPASQRVETLCSTNRAVATSIGTRFMIQANFVEKQLFYRVNIHFFANFPEKGVGKNPFLFIPFDHFS